MEESRVGDDFRNTDLALSLIRGVLQQCLLRQAMVRDVIAHPTEDGCRVGGWLDATDIELGQFGDIVQNRFQLGLEHGDFGIGQFQPGEVGDIADINVILRHARTIRKSRRISKPQVVRE